MAAPRSIFAAKLAEFPTIAVADEAAFERRGQWRDVFRARVGPSFDRRVVLEIGCSDATLLARVAAKHPHTGFVGVDWKCKALYDGAARVAGLDRRNVALLRGRGQDVRRMFADGEVDEVWVFHPDPCDRDVELKNRLIAEPFLVDAHAVTRNNGLLALKTDHPGYYQWVLGLFGLPEPPWFAAARERAAGHSPTIPAGDGLPTPRVRARDLMRAEDIPQRNDRVVERLDVAMNSPDYWNDEAALAHTSARAFSGEATSYESRFLKKRLPIYYVEMRRRQERAVP